MPERGGFLAGRKDRNLLYFFEICFFKSTKSKSREIELRSLNYLLNRSTKSLSASAKVSSNVGCGRIAFNSCSAVMWFAIADEI